MTVERKFDAKSMLGMLPRHKYADYMVVSAEYAEQDLASFHNMITIRPRAVDMAEGERIAYSEMMTTWRL